MSRINSIKFNGYERVRLVKWKIQKGAALSNGTLLFIYDQCGVEQKFQSAVDGGLVVNLLANENDLVNPGQVLIEYERCAHATVMKDLCAECGLDLRQTDDYDRTHASVSMIHSVPELKVSLEKAQQLGKADEEKLLEAGKLVLLVDPDQTLIHTTHHPLSQAKCKDVISFRLHRSGSQLYTKLRPYTGKFLEKIAKLYELHICTFGTRLYAHKIAEILDPEKKLFSHRILSRDECFDPQLKTGNLNALFPCGDSMVCIIDDREDVWNYQPNLISVKPYTFFRNTGDINSPNREKDDMLAKAAKVLSRKQSDEDEIRPEGSKDSESQENAEEEAAAKESEEDSKEDNEDNGEELKDKEEAEEEKDDEKDAETKSDEKEIAAEKKLGKNDEQPEADPSDNDDHLLYLYEILKKIHEKFYQEYRAIVKYSVEGEYVKVPDLKNLIPAIRSKVLDKVNIVFTGLIPTKLPPEQSRMWILAKQLGATVRRDLLKEGASTERTTHLVASNLNTAKVQEALKLKDVKVVNPLWLYACSQRWERVEERLFQLDKSDDFRNPDKLKTKLSFDEQLFLNYDLVKLSAIAKRERQQERSAKDNNVKTADKPTERPLIEKLQIDKAQQYGRARASETKPSFTPFPVYDPLTGKLIRSDQPVKAQSSTQQREQHQQPTTSKQEPVDEEENFLNDQADLLLELNPLSAFSTQDLKMMDAEVDDACSDEDNPSDSDERDEELEENEELDDDEENAEFDYGDEPMVKRFKRDVECLSGTSSEDASNLSFEDSNLGAQLERDFLS